jgi:hypothetical protein
MKKSKNTEAQKEADKKGKERIQRFEERQQEIKEGKKPKKELPEDDDGVRCMTAYQKKEGEDDWKELQLYYKVDSKGKFVKWLHNE